MNQYDQDSKKKVRELMLGSAITSLTSRDSGLINQDELRITFDFFLKLIGSYELHGLAHEELNEWMDFNKDSTVSRKPGNLKVLYLCGPLPTNDLQVLLSHGINIHNIWAITGSEDSAAAHKQISELNIPLKIHEGSLAEFFETYNEIFDLIYFDACGPFIGGSPSTLTPLLEILKRQRLSPKSALITNFSSPPEFGEANKRYIQLATAYFHPRNMDPPDIVKKSTLDPEMYAIDARILEKFIDNNLTEIYSDFVTELTIDLASVLTPALQAYSMPSFLKKHASSQMVIRKLINHQTNIDLNEDELPGAMRMSPSSFPIFSFLDKLENYNRDDQLLCALKSHNKRGVSYKDLISIYELTSSVFNGSWEVLSPDFLKAIKCKWFDYKSRITCDRPLPNLLVNSIVGTYGRPYFYNPRQSIRVKYIAKTREMYCDLFMFDQCRSFFDWFPTVQACPSRFQSIPFQIVARCLIDRLNWANFYSTSNPFKGGAIGGMGQTPVAFPLEIPKRTIVND